MMAPETHPNPNHLHFESKDLPEFGNRGDDRQLQYNTTNISSGQMAASATDAASSGGAVAAQPPKASTLPLASYMGESSLHDVDDNNNNGYEDDYPVDHKAPSNTSIDTLGASSESTARDSTDGRRRGSSAMVAAALAAAALATGSSSAARPHDLTAQNLEQYQSLLASASTSTSTWSSDLYPWVIGASPAYMRAGMMPPSSRTTSMAANKSKASVVSVRTESWVLVFDHDTTQDLAGIGAWKSL